MVPQVVKAHLGVRAIGHVRRVGSGLGGEVVDLGRDKADGQSKELIDLAHPFGVTSGQVVIDGDDMHAACRKGV